MANERKKSSGGRTPKKSAAARPRSRAGRRRKRKSPVYIPASKLIALCAVVIVVCSLLLAVNTALELRGAPVSDGGFSETAAAPFAEKTDVKDARTSSADKNLKAAEHGVAADDSGARSDAGPPQEKTPSALHEAEPDRAHFQERSAPSRQQPAASSEDHAFFAPDIPEIPSAQNGATLVFVFDDGGQNLNQLERFVSLPFPITVAVLPQLSHSAQAAARVRESGNEVMLHQPMQAINRNVNPGPGAITPEMSMDGIREMLRRNIAEIGPISGINNHEGSLISEDEARIGTVLQTASDMGLYFLDSRTTSQTRVPQAAMALGLSYYERNVFLDNTKNRADIIAEIMKALAVANRNGCAIMIGHIWSADILPGILLELHPLLVRSGYRFATVSQSGALISP